MPPDSTDDLFSWMTQPEAALLEIAEFLEWAGLPYMLAGAIAGMSYGVLRHFLNVEFYVWAGPAGRDEAIYAIAAKFRPDAKQLVFALRTGVLTVKAANGVTVELRFITRVDEQFFRSRAQTRAIGRAIIPVMRLEELRGLNERTRPETALLEIVEFLSSSKLPYKIYGGVAVAAWGEPQAPKDIDVMVCSSLASISRDVLAFVRRFRLRKSSVCSGMVHLRIVASNGFDAEVCFTAAEPEEFMATACTKVVAGVSIHVICLERLIHVKAQSDRPKDADDVRRLIRRHWGSPDVRRLASKLGRKAAVTPDFQVPMTALECVVKTAV